MSFTFRLISKKVLIFFNLCVYFAFSLHYIVEGSFWRALSSLFTIPASEDSKAIWLFYPAWLLPNSIHSSCTISFVGECISSDTWPLCQIIKNLYFPPKALPIVLYGNQYFPTGSHRGIVIYGYYMQVYISLLFLFYSNFIHFITYYLFSYIFWAFSKIFLKFFYFKCIFCIFTTLYSRGKFLRALNLLHDNPILWGFWDLCKDIFILHSAVNTKLSVFRALHFQWLAWTRYFWQLWRCICICPTGSSSFISQKEITYFLCQRIHQLTT